MATTPMTHGAADDAKLYDGPDHQAGHAVPNNDRKPQDGQGDNHGEHGAPALFDEVGDISLAGGRAGGRLIDL